jgi:hypothetical protein
MFQHVPDMHRARDVGRRNYDREDGSRFVGIGPEDVIFHPSFGPMRLEELRVLSNAMERLPV